MVPLFKLRQLKWGLLPTYVYKFFHSDQLPPHFALELSTPWSFLIWKEGASNLVTEKTTFELLTRKQTPAGGASNIGALSSYHV